MSPIEQNLGRWRVFGLTLLAVLGVGGCTEQPLNPQVVEAGPVTSLDAGFGVDAGQVSDAGNDDSASGDAGASDSGNSLEAGTAPDGGDAAPPNAALDYLSTLVSAAEFSALAGPGAEVKYLAQAAGQVEPAIFDVSACLFQNTSRFPYHLEFLRSFQTLETLSAEGYADWLLRRTSRTLYGGVLKLFPAARHPLSAELGVLTYTIYTAAVAAEQLTLQELQEVDSRLKDCAPFARDWLVFLPADSGQLRAAQAIGEELNAAGVAFIDPARLNAGLSAEAYSAGEAYGYLKLASTQSALDAGPRDVVLVDAAPNDLGLVAGLVTRQPQSVASHLNLRLREKGIPNAMSAAVFDNELLAQWQDLLVHLKVSANQVLIAPANLQDAEAFWQAHTPDTGPLQSDLEITEPRPFTELVHADAVAFGVKAANLGELHALLPADNRMTGFALPFAAYADFVAQPGLQAAVDALLSDAELQQSAAYKRARLKALRRTLRDAEVPAAWEEQLHAAVLATLGEAGLTTRLRFRSSTNAEDLRGVSGAGLYDSASGCVADDLDADEAGPSACLSEAQRLHYEEQFVLRTQELEDHPERTFLQEVIADLEHELSAEKSARSALKKVWASLWNERAFDDREYYALDHRQVFMGVAIHAALVGERLEAVAVTNLEPDSEQPLYRVVSQAGEVGVVRPEDPSASAEIQSFRRADATTLTDLTLVARSSLVQADGVLWSAAQMQELAAHLFLLQDHFAAEVYPDITPLQLDVEVDVSAQGQIIVKQARPYANRAEP